MFPADFKVAGAKYLFTNRRTEVNGADIYNWYNTNLVVNGWQKVSGPDQGSDLFTLVYQKANRKLNVNVYAGATHDPASTFVGYRVELLWK